MRKFDELAQLRKSSKNDTQLTNAFRWNYTVDMSNFVTDVHEIYTQPEWRRVIHILQYKPSFWAKFDIRNSKI